MSRFLRRIRVSARLLSAVAMACLLAVLVAAPASAVDAAPTFITPGTFSWTVPAGVTSISIECWGGGGGGGADSSNGNGAAGGGGGGAYAKVYSFAVTASSYNYTVGAAGTATNSGGTAGGDSSFNGTTCVADGGAAGTSGNNGSGGPGGTGGNSTGDIRVAGGTGANGTSPNGGGGGSSAGPGTLSTIVPGAGVAGNNGSGGNGGAAVLGGGPGGNGGNGTTGSQPASGPGGGGGGGSYSGSTKSGGVGFAGQIRIRYNATLSVDTPSVTYNGAPQGTTVAASVAGTVSNIKYNGSTTVPTAAGTYAITADFAPTDAANYNAFSSVSAGNFVIDKAPTTTTVTCSGGPYTYTGAAITPSCTAATTGPGGLNQAATVNYSNNTNAGTATASAAYAGTANYLASNGSTNFTIVKAPTTTAVTCTAGPFSYTGAAFTPCSATVTGAGGLSQALTVNYSNNTNAGTATAIAAYATTTNYLASSDSKNFTIDKANPTLTVSNSPLTYDGTAKTATVTSPTAGSVSNILYGGTGTAPTNAGSYVVTADFAPTDATNYNSLSNGAAGNFVINKATPTLSISNSPLTYNTAQQAATVVGSVAGTVSNILYGVSATAPTNAGTYAVKADFAPTDAANYNSLSGAGAGNFVINKATPTIGVANSPVTYNGLARTATVAGTLGVTPVAGTASNIKYNTSLTAPTNAGTYAVTANFVPGDTTNYNSVTDGGAGSFVINQAATTTTVTCTGGPFTYTGAAQTPCTAATTGTGGLNQTLTVGYSNNIGAGTATASASYAATTNYLGSSDSTTFTIGKATPTLSVSNSPQTFDGTAKTAAVVGSVGGTMSGIQYGGTGTAPTNAGTYAITADFVPTDAANYNSLSGAGAGSFLINKAATTTTVTCTGAPFTYTGAAQTPCAATVAGPGGLNQSGLTVSYGNNTNAGTASASASYAGAANYLTSNGSTTFTIGKATPTLAVNNSPATFSGAAKTATIAATGPLGTVAGSASSIKYDNSSTQPINAGTYAVTANFTPGDTANYNSLTGATAGNFVIDKATTTTTVTCAAGPFTYTGEAITPTCAAAATGPGGSTRRG